MLIIDGMDNTGKTTLAKRLSEMFGLTYLHSPSEYKNDWDRMVDWAIVQLGLKNRAIYDRFSPVTDQVYGPLLRGGTPYLDDERAKTVVELLRHTPHLFIYCRPPEHRILKFGDREQMEGVKDNAKHLLTAYDELMQKLSEQEFNIIRYDYTDNENFGPHSMYQVAKEVEKHIKKHLE